MSRILWSLVLALSVAPRAKGAAGAVSFKGDVAPILVKQCQGCHGPEKSKGGYRLDTFERLTKPGESKAAPVTGGELGKSSIFKLITAADEADRMPQKADPLPAEQILVIRRWIEHGARFDGPDAAAPLASIVVGQEHPAPPEVYRLAVPVTAIAVSPDGKLLAAGGYNEVTLWDPADGRLVGRIKRVVERTYGLAFSPDGRTLAVAGGAPGTLGEVRLCDVERRDAGRVLDRITDVMLAVTWSPDGRHLAAGGADNAIRVFSIASGARETLIEQHADWVTALAYSADGSRLASASRDRSARVFDAGTGTMQGAFLGHEEAVFGVAWLPGGRLVASAGRDRKMRIWDPAEGKEDGKATGLGADPFKVEVASGRVFCALASGAIRVYSADKRELVQTLPAPGDCAYCVAVDATNGRIMAGYHSGYVRVYDVETGKLRHEFIASPGIGPKVKAR
jgi:hypothetical protein